MNGRGEKCCKNSLIFVHLVLPREADRGASKLGNTTQRLGIITVCVNPEAGNVWEE